MATYGYKNVDGSWVQVDGIEEAIIALDKITDEEANAMVVAGSKDAAEVVLNKAKQYVPVDTGALRDSLEVKQVRVRSARYSRHLSQPVFTVGPRYVRYNQKGGVNYGHLVELGHGLKVHGGKWYVADVKAKPFLRPAADNSAGEVERIIMEAIDKTLKMFGE